MPPKTKTPATEATSATRPSARNNITRMPGRLDSSRFPKIMRRLLRALREPRVESWHNQLEGRVYYVPDIAEIDSEKQPYAPAELLAFHPADPAAGPDAVEHNKDLVYVDSAFEIRVCGMSVSRFDPVLPFIRNRNEVILYSMQKDSRKASIAGSVAGGVGGIGGEGVPFIHYDFKKHQSLDPDKYYPVPDSNGLVVRSGKNHYMETVNVQFSILEVDAKGKDLDRTLQHLDQLGGHISQLSLSIPYLALLSPAMSVVGALGSRALNSYAEPDKVLNLDMDFRVAKRDREYLKEARPAAYLRYGYYVFLSEPQNCRLYLSTNTLQNVRLMVKRISRRGQRKRRAEPFIPLRHCDYIVIRVAEPGTDAKDARPPVRPQDLDRLSGVLSTAATADPRTLKKGLTSVLEDIGLIMSETVKLGKPKQTEQKTGKPEQEQEITPNSLPQKSLLRNGHDLNYMSSPEVGGTKS